MKIAMDDIQEMVNAANVMLMVYKSLKTSEAGEGLKEIGQDIGALFDTLYGRGVAANIRAFKAYTAEGLTAEQAIELIGIQKLASFGYYEALKSATRPSAAKVSVR